MWKENIEKIRKRRGSYGRGLNEGASTGEITALREELKSQYNIELPQGYITFLKYVNGIETNGCIIYGIDEKLVTGTPKQPISGILEMNSIWYEDESQKAYLFLGEDNISWYVYELSTGK